MDLKEFVKLSPKARQQFASRVALKGYTGDSNELAASGIEYFKLMAELEQLRSERNRLAKEQDIEGGRALDAQLGEKEKEFQAIHKKVTDTWRKVPNLPDKDVPEGGEEQNKVIGESRLKPADPPAGGSNPRDHAELGAALDIIDVERGAKVAGSRFYYLKNQAAELEFALVRWIFKLLKKKGFELMVPPQMINEEVMANAGYIDKSEQHEAEVYKVDDDPVKYLVGTSEQSILGYHQEEIIDVPKRYAAFSTCFRREAGSYGKDVKGIIRTHQFDKIEMFSFVAPEDSKKELKSLVAIQEFILKKLEIPYRKVLVAAGDMGMPAAKQIDLESWIPSQNRYRETHSASNCTDWQARRAMIRYRTEKGHRPGGRSGPEGETEYVHTLNGTAVAIGRILVALLENHQQKDGSIRIPKALQPYAGFKEIKG